MPRERPSVHEIVLVRRDPKVAPDVATGAGLLPIDDTAWRTLADSDGDLEPGDEPDSWRLRSLPDGPPIRWSDGRLSILEDDATTIAKLVEIAGKLDAIVLGEDGTEYFDTGLADAASGPAASRAGVTTRIRLDEEHVRRRQAGLALVVGLGLATAVGLAIALGRHPGPWVLAGFAGLVVAGLAIRALTVPKFVLEARTDGTLVARIPNTRSSSADVAEKRVPRGELDPVELVWHALEYPAKTVREYHVRCARHPWLVFLATTKPAEARTTLAEVGGRLGVSTEDRADDGPTREVPARYKLTEAEKRKPRKRA